MILGAGYKSHYILTNFLVMMISYTKIAGDDYFARVRVSVKCTVNMAEKNLCVLLTTFSNI